MPVYDYVLIDDADGDEHDRYHADPTAAISDAAIRAGMAAPVGEDLEHLVRQFTDKPRKKTMTFHGPHGPWTVRRVRS